MIAYFLTFRHQSDPGARVNAAEATCFAEIVRATPKLQKALLFTPASAHDPYLKDEVPLFAVQLYVADIAALEAALAPTGHLQALTSRRDFPNLLECDVTQQAMVTRGFAVPEPQFRTAPGELPCTYLVAYEGTAEDLQLWLSHYITHHPPIMARFPGIRLPEISALHRRQFALPDGDGDGDAVAPSYGTSFHVPFSSFTMTRERSSTP